MANRTQKKKKKAGKGHKRGSKPTNQAKQSTPSPKAAPQPGADITHLLRIEAINIGSVSDDTDQISIRRGSSLLLRQAVIDAEGWLRELAEQDGLSEDHVKPISIGGSIGIYGLRLEQRPIASVIEHIEDKLGQNPRYRLACFSVVACESDGTDYRDARERLLAQVRWQQLRQPNRYLPKAQAGSEGVCDFDHLSPALRHKRFLKRENCFVGESVERRFDFGRKQRNRFFESELEQAKETLSLDVNALQFTSDLHELSHNPQFGNLSDKIALVYFDGNGFSKYQQKHCRDIASQAQFDERLRSARRAFLADLLQLAASDPDFKRQQAIIRLEVLMWGGDEFLLVVPAWKGWEVAQHFLKHHATTSIFEGTQKLTHAGGLVFCGAKTPMVRVRGLAQQLADWAKDKDRDKNSLAYLVLESIEYPTQGIEDYFVDRFGVLATDQRPSGASELDRDKCRNLLELVPARLLHNLGRALVRHGPTGKEYQQQKDRAIQVLGEADFEKASGFLQQLFPSQKAETDWPWLHFLELRDYLAPLTYPQTAKEDDQ